MEVPRSFFYASRRNYSLQHKYFKAAKLYGDLLEARGTLREVREVSAWCEKQANGSDLEKKIISAKYKTLLRFYILEYPSLVNMIYVDL